VEGAHLFEKFNVLGRLVRFAIQFYVPVCQEVGKLRFLGFEIQLNGRHPWTIQPRVPVDLRANFLLFSWRQVGREVVVPLRSEIGGGDGLEGELLHEHLHEVEHLRLPNQRFQEKDELKAFLVGDI